MLYYVIRGHIPEFHATSAIAVTDDEAKAQAEVRRLKKVTEIGATDETFWKSFDYVAVEAL